MIGIFEGALKRMVPESLRFKRLAFRGAEVVLETGRGDFSLDAVSGGLESIVDLVWQCSLISAFAKSFVVILDEPENHLHPEMQRAILPAFLDSFPTAQFIVATHNPLVATSAEDSSLYFLDYDESGYVVAKLMDSEPKTGTSNETLRAFFGISSSMPLWVQERLEQISKKFANRTLDDKALDEMRAEMEKLDLDEIIPSTIVDSVTGSEESNSGL